MANMLRRKLFRDIKQSFMQFLSIIILCSLGTMIFAGLDGTANLAQGTIDVYFSSNHLADFWITTPTADRESLLRLRSIEGVEDACARFSMDLDTTLPAKPTICVTAYDGPMSINEPLLQEGSMLAQTDLRGCLVQAGFAAAHGLEVGDRIAVEWNGVEFSFLIRGKVFSPEFICVTQGTYPNPQEYGYILINAQAMPAVPLTQLVVTLLAGADQQAVRESIARELPNALIMDRTAHKSTASAVNNADMFKALTLVFPVFAYAVAALIVLTTLTRMIDNQRLQIGTLKALGYPSQKIRRHYLSYAIVPSMAGSVLGVFVGHWVLPRIIWALLLGQNEYPYQIYPEISMLSWAMAMLTVLMSIGICLFTYQKSAVEVTADLLRPKPPKAGKRILLERIGPLWRRFSFNTKMIIRNLMRNRMRTMMSLIGILSCNALIIASFGLQDSVKMIAVTHYTKALHYDVRANLTMQAGEGMSYDRRLDAGKVESIMEKAVSIHSDQTSRTTLLTVVETDQQMLCLGENETHTPILAGGVAVTSKMADALQSDVGNAVKLYLAGDDEPVEVYISQIVYNNIQQGLYMERQTWEGLRKGAFVPTALLIQEPSDACLAELGVMEEVDRLERPVDQSRELTELMKMLSAIFIILMGIALALAFVICYNMGLMNFAERVREYATLKVLGYHQKEIRRLIVGENVLITILGIALSIWPGKGLTGLVLQVCASESVTYPSRPAVESIVLACVITFCFSLFIQLFLTRKVRSIDMVEALKSVE
ncbi:MAG: ABC transporter permease [Clostridia bacterium]|nr:ABC transporter permease [Clostridia bacterium]